ncbi:hypothetical protein V495_06126 [Pseudogymnoascus sp. VKM F-4514 (FW-929)]|nr:hypothetical protein V495_06126 [Pseudogymnoascus sp. VKM F-4514 (FW-929)]
MTSQSPTQTRRSNTGRPRNSASMANDSTPDQALRNLKINDQAPPAQNSATQPTTRAGEVSDDASIGSSRRHRRGGRKKNSRMPPAQEARLPWSERLDEGMSGLEDLPAGHANGQKGMPPAQEARLPWSERLDEGMSGLEDLPAGHVNGQKEKKEMPKAGGEVSDNASVASSSRPRGYKKERRKNKKGRMAAVGEAEAQIPWSERVGRLGEEGGGPAKGKAASPQTEPPPHREQSPPPKKSKKGKEVAEDQDSTQEKKEETRDTGIRAFNIRRLTGQGPPVGISIDRGEGAEGANKNADGKGDVEGEKREKPKPVSIRLDINLEIEVFLKAKIQGDVTITFLE